MLRRPSPCQMPSGAVRGILVSSIGLILISIGVCTCEVALSHEVRPAYLQLHEVADGQFTVLWKQPIMQDRRLPLDPILPEHCEATAVQREVTGSALLQRWSVTCPLDSGFIHISGLSRTITDVMVQLTRLDGTVTNVLLRPAEPSFDLSDPTQPRPTGIETLAYDETRDIIRYSDADVEKLAAATELIRDAARRQDLSLMGRACTRSARINQRFLPKDNFDQMLHLLEDKGVGEGLIAAHSGSALALLLDPSRPDYDQQRALALEFLERLEPHSCLELSNH